MRQARQRIIGPQGQPMIRTATEINDPSGLRVREVFDIIDLEALLAEQRRRAPLWKRIWWVVKGSS